MKKLMPALGVTMLMAVGAATITARPASAADSEHQFYWEDVFGFPDCYYHCDYTDPASGCTTDPDCKCTCWQ